MKKVLKTTGAFAGLVVLAVMAIVALLAWMDRWGAPSEEIAAAFAGDDLIPSPNLVYNRAVTMNAAPAEIYPRIVQLGAERGGMYSYD